MISLRKAMESHGQEAFEATLSSYRAALVSMGESAVRACPLAGEDLQASLLSLHEKLTLNAGPTQMAETSRQLEKHLHDWSERAAAAYEAKAEDTFCFRQRSPASLVSISF